MKIYYCLHANVILKDGEKTLFQVCMHVIYGHFTHFYSIKVVCLSSISRCIGSFFLLYCYTGPFRLPGTVYTDIVLLTMTVLLEMLENFE